jgi:hypothetical protein
LLFSAGGGVVGGLMSLDFASAASSSPTFVWSSIMRCAKVLTWSFSRLGQRHLAGEHFRHRRLRRRAQEVRVGTYQQAMPVSRGSTSGQR